MMKDLLRKDCIRIKKCNTALANKSLTSYSSINAHLTASKNCFLFHSIN